MVDSSEPVAVRPRCLVEVLLTMLDAWLFGDTVVVTAVDDWFDASPGAASCPVPTFSRVPGTVVGVAVGTRPGPRVNEGVRVAEGVVIGIGMTVGVVVVPSFGSTVGVCVGSAVVVCVASAVGDSLVVAVGVCVASEVDGAVVSVVGAGDSVPPGVEVSVLTASGVGSAVDAGSFD